MGGIVKEGESRVTVINNDLVLRGRRCLEYHIECWDIVRRRNG